MQYMHGWTLEAAWDSLEHNERDTICHQLRTVVDNLRQLEQDPSDPFIGLYRPITFPDVVLFQGISIIYLTLS
jgi:hypothetical protein